MRGDGEPLTSSCVRTTDAHGRHACLQYGSPAVQYGGPAWHDGRFCVNLQVPGSTKCTVPTSLANDDVNVEICLVRVRIKVSQRGLCYLLDPFIRSTKPQARSRTTRTISQDFKCVCSAYFNDVLVKYSCLYLIDHSIVDDAEDRTNAPASKGHRFIQRTPQITRHPHSQCGL